MIAIIVCLALVFNYILMHSTIQYYTEKRKMIAIFKKCKTAHTTTQEAIRNIKYLIEHCRERYKTVHIRYNSRKDIQKILYIEISRFTPKQINISNIINSYEGFPCLRRRSCDMSFVVIIQYDKRGLACSNYSEQCTYQWP